MTRTRERIRAVRHILLLAILATGLTGCQTCQNIKNKLPFLGRRPTVVTTEPILTEPLETPPLRAADTTIPEPTFVTQPTDTEPVAPRPDREPELEQALKTVHFDYDSAALTDVARQILSENLKWLREHPDLRVQIEGHCDERGTEEYNLHLGQRRADNVKRYLESNGVDPKRLFTISYGEERPIDPGHDESAWWKNRRAQFSRF